MKKLRLVLIILIIIFISLFILTNSKASRPKDIAVKTSIYEVSALESCEQSIVVWEFKNTSKTLQHWTVSNFLLRDRNISLIKSFSIKPGKSYLLPVFTLSTYPLNRDWKMSIISARVVLENTNISHNSDDLKVYAEEISGCFLNEPFPF